MVAVVAGFATALRAPLFVLDGALALLALADGALGRAAFAGDRLDVRRELAPILSVGRANPLAIVIKNRSAGALRCQIHDDPVDDASVEGLPASVLVPPRGEVTVRASLTPSRRGPRALGAITVRWPSRLGLVARQRRFELGGNVDVYPDVHAARSLELLRRQGRTDARLGSARTRGGDTEFERLRPYQRGDEIRHVDWRATARKDDLTVRQFQAESNQNVVFAVDVGRSMRGESQGLANVDHALNATLLVADVALRGGDRAGLLAFDDAPRAFLRPEGGRMGARKLTRAAFALEAGLAATDYRAAMGFIQSQIRARSLVVILTNVLEERAASELAASVKALMPRHLPLCVLLRDVDVDALALAPARVEDDLYVRAAAADVLAARESLVRKLEHAGVIVLDAEPRSLTPELVRRYWEVKARRLL